jgi:hypothetical protein
MTGAPGRRGRRRSGLPRGTSGSDDQARRPGHAVSRSAHLLFARSAVRAPFLHRMTGGCAVRLQMPSAGRSDRWRRPASTSIITISVS